MKVNVVQVKDVTFKKWRWWSDWVDVAVFDYESTPFLLQMQVNRANGKRFKNIRMSGLLQYRQVSCATIGDLTQMEANHG